MRAKFQVLVIPFRLRDGRLEVCVLTRADMRVAQFVAGGGEDSESPLEAARREAFEELGIPPESRFYALDTVASIRADCFKNSRELWGDDCFVVPEYSFAAEFVGEPSLSREHTAYEWLTPAAARVRLEYDSNKTALYELSERLERGKLH